MTTIGNLAVDGLPDDRVTCSQCINLAPNGKCRKSERHGAVLKELPRRCVEFMPTRNNPDQRTGKQRWPTLQQEIEEARRLDAEFSR